MGDEPILHALSAEPRSVRPGEIVRLCFRTPNIGAAPSPPAVVRFELPEVLEALDEIAVAVAPAAPGEDLVATVRARLAPEAANAEPCAIRATLELPSAALATNVCGVTVATRAVLDGPASGVTVEWSGPDTVRVRARIVNEGDGPARGVRVAVPPPPGCEALDKEAVIGEAALLEPGDSLDVSFEARLIAPAPTVAVDDAVVCWNRASCVLPDRGGVALVPVLAPPEVDAVPQRYGVELRIGLRNDGWCDARGVRVEVALPAGMRAGEDGVHVDGCVVRARARDAAGACSVAQLRRSGSTLQLAIARVPARASSVIAVFARANATHCGGEAIVRGGEHEVRVACAPAPQRTVRLRALLPPAAVAPGERTTLAFEAFNAGDRPERIALGTSGAALLPQRRTLPALAPGMLATAAFELSVPDGARAGETLTIVVDAYDRDAALATLELALPVRNPTPLVAAPRVEPARTAGPVCTLSAGEAVAGAPLALRLECRVAQAAETIVVRVAFGDDAPYVAGSTVLDGRTLLDRAHGAPLDGRGLTLHAVPGGTAFVVEWCVLPRDGGRTLSVGAEACIDGESHVPAPLEVEVRTADPFASRARGLPYAVDACVAGSPADAVAAPGPLEPAGGLEDDAPVTFVMRLDDERLDEIARLLRGPCDGLAAHVIALRAFFPDAFACHDAPAQDALSRARDALRDLFDRLFVKLRIPGFEPAAADLDDSLLRSALVALLARAPAGAPAATVGGAHVRVERDRLRALHGALAAAPLGSPAMLRVLVALVPRHADDEPLLGSALARYADALDAALRSLGEGADAFDLALAHGRDDALDDARASVLAALRARTAYAGAA